MATAQVATVVEYRAHPFIKKIVWTWLCTDAGVVVKETTGTYTGQLTRLITVPDGTNAPTDHYDITITDEDDVDVLIGAGVDRATAATEQVIETSLGACYNTKLELNIASAGNATEGVCILYIKSYRL
jgi:hypothetical protein